MPGLDWSAPTATLALVRAAARQAMMVAYVDIYWLLFLISVALLPLAFVMRMPKEMMAVEKPHALTME
jgi:DHA2 family multidrug resistance protein